MKRNIELPGLPAVILGLCVMLLAARLTIGVDLSDESYYAAFIDGWLKTGIEHSSNLMVHQTADLLVYPLAMLFHAVSGGSDGLILFLRSVYLAVATLASTALYLAQAKRSGRASGTLVAACALFFIPFGLPAPSYNTIGMYSLVAALALFAMHFHFAPAPVEKRLRLPASLWLSAVSWSFACVAYPTMLASLFVLLILGFLVLKTKADRAFLLRYAIACSASLAVAAVVLSVIFGLSRLLAMVLFTNAFNGVSGGFTRKAQFAAAVFATHPRYAFLLICSVVIASLQVSRRFGQLRRWIVLAGVGIITLGVMTTDSPALFVRSHDLILVLSIIGLFESVRIVTSSDSDRGARAFGVIYLVSTVAGISTALTAFNGLYNFPIGGLLSACLAVGSIASTGSDLSKVLPPLNGENRQSRLPGRIVGSATCFAIAWSAFTFYYGQGDTPLRQMVLIHNGAYKGLRTDSELRSFIYKMTDAIDAASHCGTKFAVLGNGPGFYLMTMMAPSALSTWSFSGDALNRAATETSAFYQQPTSRPDVIVVNNWRWATELSTSDRTLLQQYSIANRVVVGVRDATVYRRKDCSAVDQRVAHN